MTSYLTDTSLDKSHALITGGTRGIGLEIAQEFLKKGAKVTVCGRNKNDNNIDELFSSEYKDQLFFVKCHVGNTEELDHLVKVATEKFGAPTILVNNAGTNPYLGSIVDSPTEAWHKTMNVNLFSCYYLSQLVAKDMMEKKSGRIINISSIAGLKVSPQQGIYSISKAGLNMLTQVLAEELGKFNITVNAICPGVIKTKLSEVLWKNPDHPYSKQLKGMTPAKRFGETSEVASLALYLASEKSSFVNGSLIPVDGGLIL